MGFWMPSRPGGLQGSGGGKEPPEQDGGMSCSGVSGPIGRA
jgi:hypothetical protein